jgi:hypothetical protein
VSGGRGGEWRMVRASCKFGGSGRGERVRGLRSGQRQVSGDSDGPDGDAALVPRTCSDAPGCCQSPRAKPAPRHSLTRSRPRADFSAQCTLTRRRRLAPCRASGVAYARLDYACSPGRTCRRGTG